MAVSAHGTTLQIEQGGAHTPIAEVLDVDGPGMMFATQPYRGDGGVFVVMPDPIEPGEITFEINYTAHATQSVLREANTAQTVQAFQITFPTDPAETLAFTGYVTGFTYSAPVEGIMRASVTITLAGVMETV